MLGSRLLELLHNGPLVGIYCIVASAFSYRNLLLQLMVKIPTRTTNDENTAPERKPLPVTTLGAELILSAEGLIFFKDSTGITYQKYYPEMR